MSTMATVGYGDVTPVQIGEKIVAMVGMLVGVTVRASFMIRLDHPFTLRTCLHDASVRIPVHRFLLGLCLSSCSCLWCSLV
jgi:hypothetical protein